MTAELTDLDIHGWTPDSWSPMASVWAPRRAHAYFLEISYPAGSRAPGWRPEPWTNSNYLDSLPRKERRALIRKPFRWPRERLFLSSSGAYNRAWYLRWCGAAVQVHRSLMILWPVLPDPDTEFDASGIARIAGTGT